jgi:hypothetical protein
LVSMPSKSSQPALYEKMRSRPLPAPKPMPVEPPPRVAADPGQNWLTPGRAVRLPVGYIMLGTGLAIAMLVIVYVLGVRRGQEQERVRVDQQIITSASAAPSVADPLVNLEPVRNSGGRSSSPTPSAGTGAAANTGGWGPVVPPKDPRQRGMNYFILAETTETGAKALAEFCRSHGLETYALPVNNTRRFQIVAFPGFEGSARNSPQVRALEARIKEIGLQWKNQRASGGDNLHGMYPRLYNG